MSTLSQCIPEEQHSKQWLCTATTHFLPLQKIQAYKRNTGLSGKNLQISDLSAQFQDVEQSRAEHLSCERQPRVFIVDLTLPAINSCLIMHQTSNSFLSTTAVPNKSPVRDPFLSPQYTSSAPINFNVTCDSSNIHKFKGQPLPLPELFHFQTLVLCKVWSFGQKKKNYFFL